MSHPIVERLWTLLIGFRDEWDDRASQWGQAFWDRFERNGGLETAHAAALAATNAAAHAKEQQ